MGRINLAKPDEILEVRKDLSPARERTRTGSGERARCGTANHDAVRICNRTTPEPNPQAASAGGAPRERNYNLRAAPRDRPLPCGRPALALRPAGEQEGKSDVTAPGELVVKHLRDTA